MFTTLKDYTNECLYRQLFVSEISHDSSNFVRVDKRIKKFHMKKLHGKNKPEELLD